MSKKPIIEIKNLGKQYRLGAVGTGTFSHDVNRWWHKIRGKEDPYLKIGDLNDRTKSGNSDYVWALQDVSFDVQPGEILGIIGKNGAGKSTLLKLLSRVTAPSTGQITSYGRIASLLEVGTGFHPELTGRENIYLNGAILGMTKKEIASKFDEIVEFAGCARYIETPVKRYSSGMYVRLAFAVAAHLEPDILVVDEVLAVGDAEFQKKALGKMKEVSQGQGRTVLFVSHSMGAIRSICSSAVVLNNGTTIFKGAVDDAVNLYLENSTSQSKLHLSERKDRKTKGLITFTDLKIKCDGIEGTEVIGSSNVLFQISLNSKLSTEIIIELQITNTDGLILTVFNNFHTNNKLLVEEGNNDFFVEVPNLALTSGQYFTNLICVANGILQDHIESVSEFNITVGDFYKTNRQPDDKQILLQKHVWH